MELDEDVAEELLDTLMNGDLEQASWILNKDRNYANWSEPEQNVSILHTLAYHDLLEACKLVLSYGADPNRLNNNGESPLFWAVRMNCFQVTLTLLEYGADVHCLDNSGSTALHYACCHAVPEVIPLLLSFGCDPNVRDVDGKTALESIEREMDEDYFACTVLIRRHLKGVKNSCMSFGVSNDPSFLSIDNKNAFDVMSTGSVTKERRKLRKKKNQPSDSSPNKKELPKRPGFIAGSKSYYLHTSNSYTQRLHKEITKKWTTTLTVDGQQQTNDSPERTNKFTATHSSPTFNWNKFEEKSFDGPKSPVYKMSRAPVMEEVLQRSFCSLTNGNDVENRSDNEDISAAGKLDSNANKFLALESSVVRNRLKKYEPESLGPYFAMPFVPDNVVTERFDVIISVEHCFNCHLHGTTVRHDKNKYETLADECLRKVVADVMKNCGHLRVIGLKAESKASRIGGLEVIVAMFVPSQNKNTAKDSWEWKCKIIHSKLSTKR